MFWENDTTFSGNVAAIAADLVHQGRTSDAVDVVYEALARVGYPYRAMAEVAVKKFSSRKMAAVADSSFATVAEISLTYRIAAA
ncbi:MAG TPA: hypothetical protein VGP72_02200 [Planctomycetota bacterium]